MGYFDDKKNVESYIKMTNGYDGAEQVSTFAQNMAVGASVLELGMGPGKDLAMLAKHFDVTGSDSSSVFVDRYLAKHKDADVMVLDAVTMDTDQRFDGIYSNKVLHHLTKSDAAKSIAAQHRVLNRDGIAFHALWFGEKTEEHHGMLFQQYTVPTITQLVESHFEVIESGRYEDMDPGDSLYVVLRRRTLDYE